MRRGPRWMFGLALATLAAGLAYLWLTYSADRVAPPPAGRPIANPAELQIALIRNGFSPGSIDGQLGSQTRSALRAYQRQHALEPSGELDRSTAESLRIEDPCTAWLELDARDFQAIAPKPDTWREREFLPQMHYNSVLEMVAEHSQSDPDFIAALNPTLQWNQLGPGSRIQVPLVRDYRIARPAASIRIQLAARSLQVLDADEQVLFHCPVSIAGRWTSAPAAS